MSQGLLIANILGNGLKSFADSYQAAQDRQQRNAIEDARISERRRQFDRDWTYRDKILKMRMEGEGFEEDPISGSVKRSENYRSRKELQDVTSALYSLPKDHRSNSPYGRALQKRQYMLLQKLGALPVESPSTPGAKSGGTQDPSGLIQPNEQMLPSGKARRLRKINPGRATDSMADILSGEASGLIKKTNREPQSKFEESKKRFSFKTPPKPQENELEEMGDSLEDDPDYKDSPKIKKQIANPIEPLRSPVRNPQSEERSPQYALTEYELAKLQELTPEQRADYRFNPFLPKPRGMAPGPNPFGKSDPVAANLYNSKKIPTKINERKELLPAGLQINQNRIGGTPEAQQAENQTEQQIKLDPQEYYDPDIRALIEEELNKRQANPSTSPLNPIENELEQLGDELEDDPEFSDQESNNQIQEEYYRGGLTNPSRKVQSDETTSAIEDSFFELDRSPVRRGKAKPQSNIDEIGQIKRGVTKDGQFKAAGFAQRMKDAEGVFETLSERGFDPTKTESEFSKRVANTPLFGFLARNAGLIDENVVSQDQAERNFVNALLRRESGAAISASEFANAEIQYFPRPGDSQETLRNKKQNRMAARAALEVEAGEALMDAISQKLQDLYNAEKSSSQRSQKNDKSINLPKKGDIQDGYMFLGGNPNDKNNWKKIVGE